MQQLPGLLVELPLTSLEAVDHNLGSPAQHCPRCPSPTQQLCNAQPLTENMPFAQAARLRCLLSTAFPLRGTKSPWQGRMASKSQSLKMRSICTSKLPAQEHRCSAAFSQRCSHALSLACRGCKARTLVFDHEALVERQVDFVHAQFPQCGARRHITLGIVPA